MYNQHQHPDFISLFLESRVSLIPPLLLMDTARHFLPIGLIPCVNISTCLSDSCPNDVLEIGRNLTRSCNTAMYTLFTQYLQERRNLKQKIVASVLSTDHRPLHLATNVCPRARAQQAFYMTARPVDLLKVRTQTSAVVKIDCSKRLAFLLYDFKLISNQQQLISKTDTYVQSM